MQVELSKREVELIEEAMYAYERIPIQDASMKGILGAVLGAKNQDESAMSARLAKEMATGDKEAMERKVESVLLRAKLYQALARDSEHSDVIAETE